MIYALLILQLVIFVVIVVAVVRFIGRFRRATPEVRSAMLDPRRHIRPFLHVCGLIVLTGCITVTAVLFASGGLTGIAAMSQTKSFLEKQYGASKTGWSLSMKEHTELSKTPATGYYIFGFRYAEHSGEVTSSYREQDGKTVFDFTLSENK